MKCMRHCLCAAWNKTKDKIRTPNLSVEWEIAVRIGVGVTNENTRQLSVTE